MKKIKLCSLFLALFLITNLFAATVTATTTTDEIPVNPTADAVAPDTYTVEAKAAMLVELNSGEILLEQNADGLIYPASLTKIMTCLLVLEHGNLDDIVTVSATALADLNPAGSTAGLLVGEMLSVEQLLYAIMLTSANEACNVAAEYVSGSVPEFITLMNQRATEIGCTGTMYANTHGLHDENHYTTARDQSLITLVALENETFKKITSTTSYELPATNLSGPRPLATTNLLVNNSGSSTYYYPYASGVKTGYTSAAGRCLISTADNGKLKLLSVICGAETVILDTGDLLLTNFTETKDLFEYGFNQFTFEKVLSTLYPITQIPVTMSAGSQTAILQPTTEITALLPVNFNEELITTELYFPSPSGVEAPVSVGQILGTATVFYNGTQLGTSDLAAIIDIERSEIVATANDTKNFMENNWLTLLITIPVLLIVIYVVALFINHSRKKKYRKQRREMARRRASGEIVDFPTPNQEDNL